ncbi:unnamed protein product [Clonostachys solani]|uniref:DUF7702 domain-containing protein n=1 Tax=Clonostachys solani TaxID=160281 RepID=A0A9N9ZCH7_9HYPO|nr:unnamed protein product [Clonostachys solani]
MLGPHVSLSIAQIVFFVPIVFLAIWLVVRNWSKHPRMAWWPMVPFSLIRLVGGPIVIALGNDPSNIGLIVAAIVLLNVGTIPLIVSMSGFFRIILMDNYPPSKRTQAAHKLLRIAILIATGLLIGGGSIISQDSKTTRDIGRTLQLVGYAVFAALICFFFGAHVRFFRMRHSFIPTSRKVNLAALAALPFLALRCAYGILQVTFEFNAATVWNPVYGSAVAFAFMGLVAEYIVVLIVLYTGFSMPPDRGTTQQGAPALNKADSPGQSV